MNPFRLRRRKDDLAEELNAHLRMAVADRISRGESPEFARANALREFGSMPLVADVTRERWGWLRAERLLQDLRYVLRTLRRDRSFTIVAVLILALGIGANIVVFSVVNTLLLRPLPFSQSNQLAWLDGNYGALGLSDTSYRVDWFEAYQRNNKSFQDVSGFIPYLDFGQTKLMNRGEPRPVDGVGVLGNFFQTLGVKLYLGRQFLPDELVKGGRPAVILSYPFWQREFHAEPNAIGQPLTLGSSTYTIVGVLPASFDFGAVFAPGTRMDYFTPVITENVRDWGHMLALFGRLKAGVTVAQAQSEANILFPHLRDTLKLEGETDWKTTITGLKQKISGQLRRSLIVLWCAVGLILLIVCVNLSNLLLARSATRTREFALRVAIGAGRGRLIRQLLTESLVLSGVGAVLGLAFAFTAIQYLAHQGSISLPLLSTVRIDSTALTWTLLLALAVGLLFGIAPGLKIASGNLQDSLKDSGPNASGGKKHDRLRSTLVISEIALACVLLVVPACSCAASSRSWTSTSASSPPTPPPSRPTTPQTTTTTPAAALSAASLFRRSSAASPPSPASRRSASRTLSRSRRPQLGPLRRRQVSPARIQRRRLRLSRYSRLSPGHGHPPAEGRDFTWNDSSTSQPVIIINQAAARREWPTEDPSGKLAHGIGDGKTRVIGVIDDLHETSAEEASNPEVYVPVTQGEPGSAIVVIRSALPTSILAPSVMQVLRSINPAQAAAQLTPIQSLVDRSSSPRRFFATLVALFAALGLTPRLARHLRRHLLLRHPPDPGNRHPYGPRRNPRASPARLHHQNSAVGPHRHRLWHRRLLRRRPRHQLPALRHRTHRPCHLRRHGPPAHRRRPRRRILPGAPRRRHQPHLRPPQQLEVFAHSRIRLNAGSR